MTDRAVGRKETQTAQGSIGFSFFNFLFGEICIFCFQPAANDDHISNHHHLDNIQIVSAFCFEG
jgi:hypothetical protein